MAFGIPAWILEVKICIELYIFAPSLLIAPYLQPRIQWQCVNIQPGGLCAEGIEGDVLCTKPALVESESPPRALFRAVRTHFHSLLS